MPPVPIQQLHQSGSTCPNGSGIKVPVAAPVSMMWAMCLSPDLQWGQWPVEETGALLQKMSEEELPENKKQKTKNLQWFQSRG